MSTATKTGTSPIGITGKQRENYLSLTTAQREIYRHHYDVCGRLAAHCYQIATGTLAV